MLGGFLPFQDQMKMDFLCIFIKKFLIVMGWVPHSPYISLVYIYVPTLFNFIFLGFFIFLFFYFFIFLFFW